MTIFPPEGSRVLACSAMGFWMRADLENVEGVLARVRFVDDPEPKWLPALFGVVNNGPARVSPERIALLPPEPPRGLPSVGTSVIALWDRKRFHKGVVLRHEGSHAVVRFDEGDEHPFAARELLPCGTPDPEAVSALRARGLEVGLAVRTTDANQNRPEGWISELGSGRVYVRYPGCSYGLWLAPEHVEPGGRGRRREPPSQHEPAPGARVRARWVDRELYDAVITKVEGDRVSVRYDDGAEQTLSRARVTVLHRAPAQVPQERAASPPPALEVGAKVLVSDSGSWIEGEVAAVRGPQAYVVFPERAPFWAWGKSIAIKFAREKVFPAAGSRVVCVTEQERRGRRGKSKKQFERRSGRVGEAIGDRVQVELDDGNQVMVGPDALWQRHDAPRRPLALEVGARLSVERTPGAWEPATVAGTLHEGLARVRYQSDRDTAAVDPSRTRELPPEPSPAPPTPVPPPPIAEPERSSPTDALLREIAMLWSGGGYRDARQSATRVGEETLALEVDEGRLTVRVQERPTHWQVTIIADPGAGAAEPPSEPAMVRFAGFFRRLWGGPAQEKLSEADRVWAAAVAERATAERAGRVLVLDVPGLRPGAAEVVRWASATHARITGASSGSPQ
ncbi:MAG: hypothetical protein IT378_04285 [Sandaracinaceae bacterium]|nr:hypothetical protein [Sandaracinaceae bacterium]